MPSPYRRQIPVPADPAELADFKEQKRLRQERDDKLRSEALHARLALACALTDREEGGGGEANTNHHQHHLQLRRQRRQQKQKQKQQHKSNNNYMITNENIQKEKQEPKKNKVNSKDTQAPAATISKEMTAANKKIKQKKRVGINDGWMDG